MWVCSLRTAILDVIIFFFWREIKYWRKTTCLHFLNMSGSSLPLIHVHPSLPTHPFPEPKHTYTHITILLPSPSRSIRVPLYSNRHTNHHCTQNTRHAHPSYRPRIFLNPCQQRLSPLGHPLSFPLATRSTCRYSQLSVRCRPHCPNHERIQPCTRVIGMAHILKLARRVTT